MKTLWLMATLLAGIPAQAQVLPAFQNADFNPRSPNGRFDLILRVDGEAFVYVRGNEVTYQALSGAPLQDAGSNYSQSIPRARFGTFNMEKVAGRGSVELYEEPAAGNDYTAILRINDRDRGAELYHVRLEWTWNPGDPSRPPGNRGGDPVRANVVDPREYDRDEEGEFSFRGRVDGVTALYIRSDQVRSQVLSGRRSSGERFAFSQPIPSAPLDQFAIADVSGRGRVDLVEVPWEGNDFTAVVRIQDASSGSAEYAFRLVWRRQD